MTLLVGLIFLVVLTMISVIGFRNVTMTERMTGNAADRNVSFQSSESAGKEALQVIATACLAHPTPTAGNKCSLTGSPGFYDAEFAKGFDTAFWTGTPPSPSSCAASSEPFNWADCAAAVPDAYARNKDAAQYVIEWISVDPASTPPVWKFRVTTRSTGGSGGAEVILQTIYTHINP